MSAFPAEPIAFLPIYQERLWGGRALEERFRRSLPPGRPIGESWELVDRPEAQSVVDEGPWRGLTLGELWHTRRREVFGLPADLPGPFPILIKILDAREALSLQVHPPDRVAPELGGEPKTEMWYVAHAAPGAHLHAGLRSPGITPARFREALETGTAESLVHVLHPRASDVLFIPSGRLHAIGAGLLIHEIQENSDTTYRVYDWGRLDPEGNPRQLHIEPALRSIDFDDVTPGLAVPHGETLVACRQFEVCRWDLASSACRYQEPDRFAVFTVLDGPVRCGSREFASGRTFLVPAAAAGRLPVSAGPQGASLLRTTLPRDWRPRASGQVAGTASAWSDAGHPSGHDGFYRQIRAKVTEWAASRSGQEYPWLRYVLLAPDLFHLLVCLVADPSVPAKAKATLAGVIAYFVLPVDFLPEGLIGPVGYLDDVALAAFALNQLLNHAPPELLRRHWAGEDDILELVQEIVRRADELIGGGLVNKIRDKLGL
jgi:mannose-6-phosphate isomerase